MKIEFKASLKQQECLKYLQDNTTTEIGYGGGAGGGKSYIGVFGMRMLATKYPGTRFFFGRKELTNLRKTTLNTYYKFLQEYDIPEVLRGTLNNKDNIIHFQNGSEIFLLDLAYQPSDPLYTRFGSLELTGGFVDESNEVQNQCLTILSTRIGRQNNEKYGLKPKMLETFNPDKGHVYNRFYKPRKSGTLPKYRVFIPALATDNPHIDKNYIEQLQKADEITKQRLLYGNFEYDDTPGKLFRHDEILDSFNNIITQSHEHFLSCDIARLGKDNTVLVVRRGLEVLEIISYNGVTTEQSAENIKNLERKYNIPRNNIIIDSDGIGGGVADNLRGCVNFVNNASAYKNPNMKTQIRNYGNLKTQCYFKLKEVMEKRLIKINADGQIKDCIMQELDNIIIKNLDKDQAILLESKDDMKQRIGRSPDYADALMMRMYKLVREGYEEHGESGVFTIDYGNILC